MHIEIILHILHINNQVVTHFLTYQCTINNFSCQANRQTSRERVRRRDELRFAMAAQVVQSVALTRFAALCSTKSRNDKTHWMAPAAADDRETFISSEWSDKKRDKKMRRTRNKKKLTERKLECAVIHTTIFYVWFKICYIFYLFRFVFARALRAVRQRFAQTN